LAGSRSGIPGTLVLTMGDDDQAPLVRAEAALTEIKVTQGLSDEHASVLAALRIRLKGEADKSLEELLASAGDLGGPSAKAESGEDAAPPRRKGSLDDALAQPKRKGSLDDVLAQPEKPKPEWPS
jgi:hypothetical protein